MADYIIIAIVGLAVLLACRYIYKEKKKGRKCIGCPYSGNGSCHCNEKASDKAI